MMSRIIKQILYGAGYIVIFGLIFWGISGSLTKAKPTCFDGIRNQDEVGIDCGGRCAQCALSQMPLEVRDEIRLFHDNFERVVLLGIVANPNTSYRAAQFSYRFVMYDKEKNVIERIDGRDSLGSSRETLLFAGPIDSHYDDIDRIELQIQDTVWESALGKPEPKLVLSRDVKTLMQGNAIRVSGVLENQSPFETFDVRVIAILMNSFGDEVFVSQTIVREIAGFEKSLFTVFFPESEFLRKRIDPTKTKIFIGI